MSHTARKILVIRFGALGDMFHVSPSLRTVKDAYPEVTLHVLTSPMYEPLVKNFSGVDQVWTWDKQTGSAGLSRLAWSLRREGFDTVVNLHPSLKTWFLTHSVGAARTATYRKEKIGVKGQPQRILHRRHAVEDFYQPFILPMGLPQKFKQQLVPQYDLGLSTSSQRSMRIAILPGVGHQRSNRAWPLDRYQALVQRLLTHDGLEISILGGPDEVAAGAALAALSPRITSFCGTQDFLGTAQHLNNCQLVIGGDTGPLHMAAALGVNVLGLYGPTSVDRTGPLGLKPGQINILTPPEAVTTWPCETVDCQGHLPCITTLSVDSVVEQSLTVLENIPIVPV